MHNGEIREYHLTTDDFGLPGYDMQELRGGTGRKPSVADPVITGEGTAAQSHAVAANVALLMKLNDNEDLQDNAQHALAMIRSGNAFERVTALAARG